MALRNRIVMAPMGTNQERVDGRLGPGILRYYEERARGGAGLIIAGVAAVAWPEGACNPNQAALSDDRFLPDFEDFARRCHAHGARAAVQLQHAGKVAQEDIAAGRPLLAPSLPKGLPGSPLVELSQDEMAAATGAFARPGAKLHYREMDEGDIARLIGQFADAAERAARAGLDGVELHAGHGYLLQAFLSPATNRRSDAWGGSREGRARLLCETLRAVRRRIGPEVALWCRLDGAEFGIAGGIGLEDACRTAELAAAAGADAIHVSAYADPASGAAFTRAPLVHEPAAWLPLAEAVRRRAGVPVIAVGRLSPEAANAAIAAGRADFAALGRALLADSALPAQLAAGHPERARPCIYSYQCVGNIFLRRAARCTVNPRMGREWRSPANGEGGGEANGAGAAAQLGGGAAREAAGAQGQADGAAGAALAEWPRAAVVRRVVVVGGGPAGLEAARVAAQRGHRVALFERAPQLGGRARLAARLDADPAAAQWLAWLEAEARRAGVAICTGAAPAPGELAEADALVVATGARRLPLPGANLPHACTAEQIEPLLEAGALQVAVLGADAIGVAAACALARAGHQVALLSQGTFAPQLALPRRWRALELLEERGAQRVAAEAILAVEPGGVRYRDAEGEEARLAAERVVIATGLAADPAAAEALRAPGIALHAVGDCAGPRYLAAAIREAAELAAAL